MQYFRPIVEEDTPPDAYVLAGGWCRFRDVEVLERGCASIRVSASSIPNDALLALTQERTPILGLPMTSPHVMGIINATPDSFSDGGDNEKAGDAVATALEMVKHGVSIIDVGGESTRPGAKEVPAVEELARVNDVVAGFRQLNDARLSIDTRKSTVASGLGAPDPWMVNDVSAFRFDPDLATTVAAKGVPVCLMHSLGTPETMQHDPNYTDVVLDVFDHLKERIDFAVAAGVKRDRIIVDPGIGFGKTLDHNLALLRGLSIFHGLGCPILLGASRKRFIGTIAGAEQAKERLGGSVSVALHGVRQGVQIARVHDTFATKQAFDLHMRIMRADENDT